MSINSGPDRAECPPHRGPHPPSSPLSPLSDCHQIRNILFGQRELPRNCLQASHGYNIRSMQLLRSPIISMFAREVLTPSNWRHLARVRILDDNRFLRTLAMSYSLKPSHPEKRV
jgi:hypothetical protein